MRKANSGIRETLVAVTILAVSVAHAQPGGPGGGVGSPKSKPAAEAVYKEIQMAPAPAPAAVPATPITSAAEAPKASPAPVTDKKAPVKGTGCVEAGVTAGCLVVHNAADKKLYNLFFKSAKPAVGVAIAFEGVTNSNPNACMQGASVDVAKWTQIRLPCPKAKQD